MLREEIKRIASKARSEATSIYRHRGKIIKRSSSSDDIVVMWKRIKRRGKYFYKLNFEYPLIKKILDSLLVAQKKDFKSLLNLIGETVPSPAIAVTHSEEPDTIGKPFEGCAGELKQLGIVMLRQLIVLGNNKKQALRKLSAIEPFDSYPELLEIIEQEMENADK
jgi:hypothetical protein